MMTTWLSFLLLKVEILSSLPEEDYFFANPTKQARASKASLMVPSYKF